MLQLKNYEPERIPELTGLIAECKNIIASIDNWQDAGVHHGVQTRKTWLNRDFWAGRTSVHANVSYEAFRKLLFTNHTENEAKYMKIITNYTPLEVPLNLSSKGWASYDIEYKLPFPLKKRHMTIWIIAVELDDCSFMVISLPRPSLHVHGEVDGAYASIELVSNQDDGIHWTMVTTSDAGGYVPGWIQRMTVAKTLAEDVPTVLEYIEKNNI